MNAEDEETLEAEIAKGDWHKTNYIAPHQYIKRDECPELFEKLKALIKSDGYYDTFQGVKYRYVKIGEWRYWAFNIILNRTRIDLYNEI